MFRKKVLHGSGASGVSQFSRHYSSSHWAFGPGIYCTDHERTARSQSNSETYLYELEIRGPYEGILELDRPICDTNEIGYAALQTLGRRYGQLQPCPDDPVYTFLDKLNQHMKDLGGKYEYPHAFATHLVEQGVWMLRGEMPQGAGSGNSDYGVQYVVLDDRCVSVIRQFTTEQQRQLLPTDSLSSQPVEVEA